MTELYPIDPDRLEQFHADLLELVRTGRCYAFSGLGNEPYYIGATHVEYDVDAEVFHTAARGDLGRDQLLSIKELAEWHAQIEAQNRAAQQ